MRHLTLVIQVKDELHAARVYELLALAAGDIKAELFSARLGETDRLIVPAPHPAPLLYERTRKPVPIKPPRDENGHTDILLGKRHTDACYAQLDSTGECICG
jgi:hypothetical protein